MIRLAAPVAVLLALAACDGPSSMLAGAGPEAAAVEALFWPMLVGAAVIWAAVIALALHAARTRPHPGRERTAELFVIWGGMVLPAVLLVALLVAGLLLLRDLGALRADLRISVEGEQWWWRVAYETPQGPIRSANEIRLPQGRTAEFALRSDDVIHSFWAPALGGKMDMIPGRTTTLRLTPTRTGRWAGSCAEFCGLAHAQMRFAVVVLPPAEFDDWAAAEASPARNASEAGRAVFASAGCGACHTIRGTAAAGLAGPDLTHLAARETIAAGILPLTRDNLRAWIRNPAGQKPGALMPGFPDLATERMEVLLDYLAGLT